jgi:hypothetical protein
MKNHGLWMVVGCVLPVLLIFILPTLGVSNNVSIFIFILLMFGCHLFMMGGHRDHSKDEEREEHKQRKEGGHEFH